MDKTRSTNDARPVVEYHRLLKPLLPERAFAPSPGKLIPLATHLLIVVSGYAGIRFSEHWPIWCLCSLVIGHSLACIALFAHELSHNTVIRNRGIRYFLELIAWGLNFLPPTVWRRIHNQTHHVHSNTVNDPDRRFLASEASLVTGFYTRTFFPNKRAPRWNPLVWLYFMPYILRNTVAAFYPSRVKPTIVPSKPRYTASQRIVIAFEIATIAFLQVAIYHSVGGSWQRFSVCFTDCRPGCVMRCPAIRIYEPLLESNWRIQRSACRFDLGDRAPLVQFPAFQRLVSHRAPSLSRYEFGVLSGCQPLGSGTLRGSLPSCQHLPRLETPLAERSFCGD